MLCRMNFLCAVVRQPTRLFVSVVNVFLFVLNPYPTVPDFIVSKQSVRITFFFTTFLWFMASAFFFNRFIAQTVYTKCTKISYKIVPATNFTT